MTRPGWILISSGAFLALAPCCPGAESPWQNMVGNYCLDCHDGLSEKGGLNLELLLDEEFAAHSDEWERVLRQIGSRQMPPVGKDRPDEAGYESAVDSLVAALDENAEIHPNPGRTDSIRRLTRTEYQNAIRDLLALEVDVAELLPADESSHGFDNITVGDLSPALLERYLSAAQKISRLAVGTPLRQPDSRTVRLKPDLTQEHHVEGLPLGTRGGSLVRHHFPRSGEYEIQVRLTRDRNDLIEGLNGKHQLVFLIDGDQRASLEIAPPKNRKDHTGHDANLKVHFDVEAGPQNLGVTFLKQPFSVPETFRQPYEAHFNYHRHPRITPALYEISITGPFEDQGSGETPSRKRLQLARELGENDDPLATAQAALSPLMRIAWRRPVSEADLDLILPFFEQGFADSGTMDGGLEAAVAAILVSREFLFRTESDPADLAPGTAYSLSDLALASRLSFFLWSSLPDNELLAAAERGELTRDPASLESQARRMLADPRARSLVTNFADQWLYLRNLETITPDGRLFPGFDDNLRQAFREETERLFADVVTEDRSVVRLLDSDFTYLNERLAKHYGIPHVYGTRFRKVALDDSVPRGGLLRHGSILTVTSYATRTSPVIRGHWILENLLGSPPPPPPPDVPALEDNDVAADLPFRERLAEHRKNVACASCHDVMDPIGFALENFDAVGRWRSQDQGLPVDASGGLADGTTFEGVDGLEAALIENPDPFVRTLTEKLLTFGLGRGVEPSDGPAVRAIAREAAKEDYRFSAIVTAIVKSPPFTQRLRASEDAPGSPDRDH